MSVTKIAILVGTSIITAGSTAAVATRDKWWPTRSSESISEVEEEIAQPGVTAPAEKSSKAPSTGDRSSESPDQKKQ